jgi:NADPH:quinone reductase
MTKTMRALVGGLTPDWEILDVDVPTPGPGQILVRVRAAGINRADLYMLEGTYNPDSKTSNTFTAGFELAGQVETVGAGVENLAAGDRVMAVTLGAFAPTRWPTTATRPPRRSHSPGPRRPPCPSGWRPSTTPW